MERTAITTGLVRGCALIHGTVHRRIGGGSAAYALKRQWFMLEQRTSLALIIS
jgi:hypothetical protein